MSEIFTQDLVKWLDENLKPHLYQDYAPNGLQVQGRSVIKKVITGVTASQALLEKAIEYQADAVIVHHGWFWKNEDVRILGAKYQRIALAIKHDLNIIGYHLPLDAHPEWGNNRQLAKVLDLQPFYEDDQPQTCGRNGLVWQGSVVTGETTLADLGVLISQRLEREPLLIGDTDKVIRKVAWCTGGGQGMFQDAIDAGVDVFITGEASEPVYHMARESGVAFIAAGHHATERYGIQALGNALVDRFGIAATFVDIPNPV
ncbi:Nif3-like dinuclear metal center hexameric protein [Advenella alkanexedens]|uniref:Nif3-like dinuclear metal center hexameric protein n=1 Tax=Advenella alkanexedens TaxID=1481665 RepID=UPI002674D296|nr:Nif3-like dinuclear metal center hexameric protein [Advenella alkanexedens]WKU19403.1 Nif3-like dinuclear metal center hexameric protein [Advenella alkanexedens]